MSVLQSAAGRARAMWRDDPRARAIFGFVALLAVFVPINLALQMFFGISTLSPLRWWLTANAWATDDSWKPMAAAYHWIKGGAPDGSLYQEVFFREHLKFQYPPTSLLPYAGLDAIGLAPEPVLLNRINRILLLVSAIGVGALAWMLMKRLERAPGDSNVRLAGAIVIGAAVLLFFPMTYGYQLGQLQVWGNALFIFACIAWLKERRVLAGVLLGLVCLMKPQLAVFVLWGVLRREWRFLGALIATGAIGLIASVALFGLHNHIAYLDALSYMGRHGEAHLSNQSFNGLLHRLVNDDDGLGWSNYSFSPYSPIVYAGTLITSVIILGLALWPRGSMQGLSGLLQFELAALAFTIASPIAWEPHYGVLAPALATLFCLAMAMNLGKAQVMWFAALALCFAVTANHLPFVRAFAHTPLLILQSYMLFAGLAVVAMLWRLSAKSRGFALTKNPAQT